MGNTQKGKLPQVLVVGLEGSGKSSLVYSEETENPEPTQSFKYFEKEFLPGKKKLGIWDLSGKDCLQPLWSAFYKNILFQGVVFVIDYNDQGSFDQAVERFHFLTNEEELRDSVFLAVLNDYKIESTEVSEELQKLVKAEKLHPSVKFSVAKMNVKKYNSELVSAFEWLYSSISV